jgi:aspartate racemase
LCRITARKRVPPPATTPGGDKVRWIIQWLHPALKSVAGFDELPAFATCLFRAGSGLVKIARHWLFAEAGRDVIFARRGEKKMKTLGIVAHSAEGGALCFLTACRVGAERLGPHLHPPIVLSAVPMGWSMPGWEANDYAAVARHLADGVRQVAAAGADFFICPDNTAHLTLEPIAADLPLPGLHIAHVVCAEILAQGWKRVGLLGTRWTMTGSVYAGALKQRGLERMIPDEATREKLNAAIFDELCQGVFRPPTTDLFLAAIHDLRARGAECVILGCTEIPLIVTPENSPLPVLDSTRLLARYGVQVALDERPFAINAGWLEVTR